MPADILEARAIEQRLYDQTWLSDAYDLLPQLTGLNVPTLVLHGDLDFIPLESATRIARAIPAARLVVLPTCGHFSFLECPDQVRQAINAFFDTVIPKT